MAKEVKNYKLKALPSKPIPDAILYIKADGDATISTYITDVNGIPYPLKDDGSVTNPGVQTVFNTDGTISIIGTTDVKISIQSDILDIINSAVQPEDLPSTKVQFNNQLVDGNFLFAGDVSNYTDEQAQDAVGNTLTDTTTIDFNYNDAIPSISASVKPNSITPTELADNINLTEFVNNVGFENTSQLNTRDTNNRNRANHTGIQAISTVVNLQSSLDAKENKAEKNIANGYAGLDVNGKILKDQLPIRLVWGYITAINGGTRTITSDEDILSVDASATIANYTINLPLSLTEAKEVSVTFNVSVTNLTIGAGGVIDYYPTKAKVYDTYTWAYEPIGNQWILKSYWSGDLGAQINGLSAKTTLADNDSSLISDSENSNTPKKFSLLNLWNYIKIKINVFKYYVTPEEYGAVGDGVTDDKTSIQNAVNSGKPVITGFKNYYISGSIQMPLKSSLSGIGEGTLFLTNGDYSAFEVLGADVSLFNFGIIGTGKGLVNTNNNAILLTGNYPTTTRSTLKLADLYINNFSNAAIKQAIVSYTLTVTATNPLLAGNSTANVFLEYSPNGGTTWLLPSQNGNLSSVALAVAVAITSGQTSTVNGIIPANALVRLRTSTSGTASVTYVTGTEIY